MRVARHLILCAGALSAGFGGFALAGWLEASMERTAESLLVAGGYAWAMPDADGATLALSGAAPSTAAAASATAMLQNALPAELLPAKAADQPSILSANAEPSIEIRRTPGAIVVAGPIGDARNRIVETLSLADPDANITTVSLGDGQGPAIDDEAARAIAALASALEPGAISLNADSVALSGAAKPGTADLVTAALDALAGGEMTVTLDGPLALNHSPAVASACVASDCADPGQRSREAASFQLAAFTPPESGPNHPLDKALSSLTSSPRSDWTLSMALEPTGRLVIKGGAPSHAAAARLAAYARAAAPGRDVRIETGVAAAPAGWRAAAFAALDALGRLESGAATLSPRRLNLTGIAAETDAGAAQKALSAAAKGWTVTAEIEKTAAPDAPFAAEQCAAELASLSTSRPLTFEPGNADLAKDGRQALILVAKIARRCAEGRIEVAGYTDSSGRELTNLFLSRARAETVVDALLTNGVRPGIFFAKGYGEADPIASNATEAGRARNRRIEFQMKSGAE